MLKELVQELNEILGEVETLTKENKELENRITELEGQVVDPIDLAELKSIVEELKSMLSE